MRVLEAPVIWILVALVLVALAALFIVTASMRRSRARRRAIAWDPAAALEPSAPARSAPDGSAPDRAAPDRSASDGSAPGPARRPAADPEPVTVPLDLSATRGPTAPPSGPRERGEAVTGDGRTRQDEEHVAARDGASERSHERSHELSHERSHEPVGGPVASAEAPREVPGHGARGAVPGDPEVVEDRVRHEVPEHREAVDDESLVAPLFRPWSMQNREDGRYSAAHPRHASDHDPAAPVLSSEEADTGGRAATGDRADDPAATPPADQGPARATSTGDEAAKDRLLAVLLRDPAAAVRALSAGTGSSDGIDTEHDPDAARGASATDLLRAGLTPAQVAQLIGVGESELAAVVARGLGLLGRGQDAAGRSRTVEPGRSWANAASAPGSTTPTTG